VTLSGSGLSKIYPTLTRAQAQCTAEGATRFDMRGNVVLAHRPSKARPGEEATCAIVQVPGGWRCEGWVS
jgi:hypothetical protein